jgi:hypothetical protein
LISSDLLSMSAASDVISAGNSGLPNWPIYPVSYYLL